MQDARLKYGSDILTNCFEKLLGSELTIFNILEEKPTDRILGYKLMAFLKTSSESGSSMVAGKTDISPLS